MVQNDPRPTPLILEHIRITSLLAPSCVRRCVNVVMMAGSENPNGSRKSKFRSDNLSQLCDWSRTDMSTTNKKQPRPRPTPLALALDLPLLIRPQARTWTKRYKSYEMDFAMHRLEQMRPVCVLDHPHVRSKGKPETKIIRRSLKTRHTPPSHCFRNDLFMRAVTGLFRARLPSNAR